MADAVSAGNGTDISEKQQASNILQLPRGPAYRQNSFAQS